MNGPNPICSACGALMKVWGQPFCDSCMGHWSGPPVEHCLFCEQGRPRDRTGLLHLTATGGYMGKCDNPNPPSTSGAEGTK